MIASNSLNQTIQDVGAISEPMFRVYAEYGLKHAALCVDPTCGLQSCIYLKRLIGHAVVCETGHERGCSQCGQHFAMVEMHAKLCKEPNCSVLRCENLRPKRQSLVRMALSGMSKPLTALRRTFSKQTIATMDSDFHYRGVVDEYSRSRDDSDHRIRDECDDDDEYDTDDVVDDGDDSSKDMTEEKDDE